MKKETLHLRVDQSLKDRLSAAAEEERRTVSNLVLMILEVWLEKERKHGKD